MAIGHVCSILMAGMYTKLIQSYPAFDLDTVKMLMSIFDTDRSGTIGFNEVCNVLLLIVLDLTCQLYL